MRKRTWLTVGSALVVVAGIAAVTHWMGRDEGTDHQSKPMATGHPGSTSSPNATSASGGVHSGTSAKGNELNKENHLPGAAPEAGTAGATATSKAKETEATTVYGYGRTPTVAPDANPNVVAVVEAIQTKSHPERLSSLIAPAPFDKAAYQADPQAYLNVSEPGRVYQTAQPGKDVPVLRPNGPQFIAMTQGQAMPLAVKTLPGAPVTFTSADLGRFENQLTSITVAADAKGIAKTQFTASPGTINTVRILSGSPLATGQVEFVVQVDMPPAPGSNASGSSAAVPASATGG